MGLSSSKGFSIQDMQDLSNKIILVTGGNIGIGLAIIKGFAAKSPAKIILAARSEARINEALQELRKQFPTVQFQGELVDLSSFASIAACSARLHSNVDHIDILVNNAGVFMAPTTKTSQGFDLTLGINTFGTAYFTKLVLPLVEKSPTPGRIILVSSGSISMINSKIFETYMKDITGSTVQDTSMEVYGVSKVLITMYAMQLQQQLQDIHQKTLIFCVNPGWIKTDNFGKANTELFFTRFLRTVTDLFASTPDIGALSTLYAATNTDVANQANAGKMFGEGPHVKLYKFPEYFTPKNSARVFEAIEDGIQKKL